MSAEFRIDAMPGVGRPGRSGRVTRPARAVPAAEKLSVQPGRRQPRLGAVLAVAVLVSLLMWAGIIALVLAVVR
jgi:hypothetical protein